MNVNPADTASIETSMADECNHISMRNYGCLLKLLIVVQ